MRVSTIQPISRRLRRASGLLAIASTCGCVGARGQPAPAGSASPPLSWSDVIQARDSRDFFALRDRLARTADTVTVPARFARALVYQAFNDPAASNRGLAALLSTAPLNDSLRAQVWRAQMDNDVRLFAYAHATATADSLLAHATVLDSATRADVANTRRIAAALAGIPPQTVAVQGPTDLHLDAGRIPVSINDSARSYVFDTGANLSTIMRSEAVAVGLRIIPAGIDVGSSTTHRVTADLGVADDLRIGGLHFAHVVFLVLDDSLLTFGSFRIPGIVGFPVIDQMGEVRFERGGRVEIPVDPPRRSEHNLALAGLTPLTQVGWNGDTLVCSLDTGADGTEFYERFYRANRPLIDSTSTPSVRRFGGAGGIQTTPVRVLRHVRLALGDTIATLDSASVLTHRIARNASEDYRDCNLGHDVFDSFGEYVIDFRDMAFVLR